MQFPERLEEVVSGIFYKGEMFVMAGCPSAGKSRNQLHLAYMLASGKEGWHGQYSPMDVLYCSQRTLKFTGETLRTVKGINDIPDNLRLFCIKDLSKEQHILFIMNPLAYIRDKVLINGYKPKVVFLDCLWNFFPRTIGKNVNDYNTLTNDCDNIVYWAKQVDCAISALHHASKQKENAKYDNPMDRILGSQAILASCCAAGVIEKMDYNDNSFVRLHLMSHIKVLPTPLYFDADTFNPVSLDDVDTRNAEKIKDKAKRDSLTQVEQIVYQEVSSSFTDFSYLIDKCKPVKEFTHNNITNVVRRMEAKGVVIIRKNNATDLLQVKKNEV